MNHVHVDPFGGLAGDMFVAAALDAGLVDRQSLEELLNGVGLGRIGIVERTVQRRGISALHVRFEVGNSSSNAGSRNLSEILDLLDGDGLPSEVAEEASAMFRTLGSVEAAVHDVPLADVHFHEVGAVDSILDFVSAAAIIRAADAQWSIGPVSVGSGEVETEHGLLPVPAPATAELLRGFHLVPRSVRAELVTPTGACILRHLDDRGRIVPRPPGVLKDIGYGAGSRQLEQLPNVVRLLSLETDAADRAGSPQHEIVCRLSSDIDDMNPELFGQVEERLLAEGALDVTRVPVHMKKGRNGIRLSVTIRPNDQEEMIRHLFRETTTLGVRVEHCERRTLDRRSATVWTPYGEVEVKVGYLDGAPCTVAPEYESCRDLATRAELPVRGIYDAAKSAAVEQFGQFGEG